MSTVGGRGDRGPRGLLWVAGVLLMLAGLLGMHGLAQHGTASMGGAHAVMTTKDPASATSMPGNQEARDGSHTLAAHKSVAVAAGAVMTSGGGLSGSDMGTMCLAVLLLTLLALVLRMHASRERFRCWWALQRVQLPAREGRQPDPPDLLVLSIQRC